MRDQRSAEAEQYRLWYKRKAWLKLRAAYLAEHPLCVMCEAEGRLTQATVVDHVNRHAGSWDAFIGGPFQALCVIHHNTTKQREEHRGPSRVIGLDGWPVGG